MLKISKEANNNYLAKIVKLENVRKLEGSDFLQIVTIDFQNVITGLDSKEGMIFCYFPVECAINKDYLSWSNSFENKDLNTDPDKKGFFNKHGRVRCIKLRGTISQGYIVPLSNLEDWLQSIDKSYKSNGITGYIGQFTGEDNYDNLVGTEFDSWDDIIICKKYISANQYQPNSTGKQKQAVKYISRLVENQFRLHVDTDNLRRNIHKIDPEDYIGIHYKKHGTSFVCGNVLVKRKLSKLDKIAKFFGANIKETEYDVLYSSRKVIKNERETIDKPGFYKEDIWGIVKEEIKDKIPKGFSLFGEILGYLPSGGEIQKSYDYGCNPGEHKVYIYRITFTNEDGQVFEFDDNQIKEYCNFYGLNYSDTFIYYGKAKDLYPSLNTEEHWHENLLTSLEKDYNDKNCYICRNKVPEE
jgi:hypothetical protein